MSAIKGVIKGAQKGCKVMYRIGKAHKSTICVGFGLMAGGAALYSCAKATAKSVREIDEENAKRKENNEEPLTKKEKIQMAGKNYASTGVWTVVSFTLICCGQHMAIKDATIATAMASESDRAYEALRDSVNDILSDDKETKTKVVNKFDEIYGDSNQPIDRYQVGNTHYDGYTKYSGGNVTERFKDEYGFECKASRSIIQACRDIFKVEAANDIQDATLADFYYNIERYGGEIISQPEHTHRIGYTTNEICDFDYILNADYDTAGLYYSIDYSLEPTNI